ncbi:unnamed protein product [Amoebophrya sp. A120]|nr:unnamed protein product [Amoebophrya sp. A120]|eukprot:GSA120T00007659001.1
MPIEPIGCHYADKAPVGGSFYGNYFQRNQAYEGFVYSVREREIMPKDYNAPDHIRTNHYQREVGRREKITHERFNALGTSHHSEKLKEEPTLTPKQQEEFAKTMKEPLYKFDWGIFVFCVFQSALSATQSQTFIHTVLSLHSWTDNFKDPHFIVLPTVNVSGSEIL